jgi:hypothetical protein
MSKRIEDTKEVIRGRKPKKDKQYNGQKQKDKQRSTQHSKFDHRSPIAH